MKDNDKIVKTIQTLLSPDALQTLIDGLKDLISNAVEKGIAGQHHKELMTFNETMELLDCSPSALNKWKSEGKIPYRRLKGTKRIYFLRSEIIAALEEAGNSKRFRELK